jgi:hypothetical protein
MFLGRVFGIVESPDSSYAVAISKALQQDLGNTHRTIKTLTGWTSAAERTVKNWLSGRSGPSGKHLLALICYSDEVLEATLLLSGRRHLLASVKTREAIDKLADALKILQLDEG